MQVWKVWKQARRRAGISIRRRSGTLGIALALGLAWPGGASAADASALLARARAAAGGDAWSRAVGLVAEGSVETGGLTGSVSMRDDLVRGRYTSRYALGPATGGNGFDGTHAWNLGSGGEVTLADAPGAQVDAANQAWLTAHAYWFPERRPGRIDSVETRSEAGASCTQVVIFNERTAVFSGVPLRMIFSRYP